MTSEVGTYDVLFIFLGIPLLIIAGVYIFVSLITVLIMAGLSWPSQYRLRLESKLKAQADADRLEEVKVHLAFGRKKEAKVLLKDYLISHPDDQVALDLLNKSND